MDLISSLFALNFLIILVPLLIILVVFIFLIIFLVRTFKPYLDELLKNKH